MPMPQHPIDAVTHPDPWPYYARLRESPVHWDAAIGLWVAAHEDTVAQALAHPALRVRPPAEPVPAALRGTPAGEVFVRLIRMNDGDFHRAHRPGAEKQLAGWTADAVAACAADAARDLLPRCGIDAWLSAVPVQAMARLLGVPAAERDATCAWVADFTQGIAPGADASRADAAGRAARHLMAQARALGLDDAAAAQRIAFMQQSMDATAGLLGEALRTGLHASDPAGWRVALAQLARLRPPVHNTRRFAAEPLALGGQAIAAGQGVLLVLAAARMPFGAGAHRCPGEALAIGIAAGALDVLRGDARAIPPLAEPAGYRPLAHARIPVFNPPQRNAWSP